MAQPDKRWQKLKERGPCNWCVHPPFLVIGTQQVRHLLEKREFASDNHISARQLVEWTRADLFRYIISIKSRITGKIIYWKITFTFGLESTFSLRIPCSLSGEFHSCGILSIPSLKPQGKSSILRTPYIFWLYVCGHLVSIRVHPPRLPHSFQSLNWVIKLHLLKISFQ